jgi:hypothetical protein
VGVSAVNSYCYCSSSHACTRRFAPFPQAHYPDRSPVQLAEELQTHQQAAAALSQVKTLSGPGTESDCAAERCVSITPLAGPSTHQAQVLKALAPMAHHFKAVGLGGIHGLEPGLISVISEILGPHTSCLTLNFLPGSGENLAGRSTWAALLRALPKLQVLQVGTFGTHT